MSTWNGELAAEISRRHSKMVEDARAAIRKSGDIIVYAPRTTEKKGS